MSSTLIETIKRGEHPPESFMAGVLKLRGAPQTPSTSAFPELETKGYTVVRGAVSPGKAERYGQEMYKWAESFGLGFDHTDRSTWHVKNMPAFNRGGLINRHGVGHEQFAWDIRAEPGVIDAFAKIWGTDQLLVSFDAINISIPYPAEELEGTPGAPWPHVDQSPNRRFKHCVQGIVNLNGDDDGGLMVLEGSLPLYNEFFETHEHEAPEGGWLWRDSYSHTEAQIQWFLERGCKWVKVNAQPGDLILWDSRCIHYGAAARGDNVRLATYVCYKPAADIQPEMQQARQFAIQEQLSTSHDPLLFRLTGARFAGKLSDDERTAPLQRPTLTPRMEQLAGTRSY